jgi:ATP-dependent Clp protease ATP-binding subunit ClpB
MQEKGVTVEITDGLLRSLVEQGYNDVYGARALRREVQEKIENLVADMILRDEVVSGKPIVIDHL